jgi:hypothetical protein
MKKRTPGESNPQSKFFLKKNSSVVARKFEISDEKANEKTVCYEQRMAKTVV